MPKGGKREGAGKPPLPAGEKKLRTTFFVRAGDKEKVREFIKSLDIKQRE